VKRDHLVLSIDLAPTLLEIAGLPIPPLRKKLGGSMIAPEKQDSEMETRGEDKQYQVGKVSGLFIITILSILMLSDYADRAILFISLQAIKETFKLTDAQAGMLPSLLQFGIAIMTIPTAMLADRLSRRKVIMAMSFVWCFFTLTTGLAQQVWHMFISRFMVGAGEAGYQPAGQTWLGVVFRKEIRGRIMAVFFMFQHLGGALGLFLGGLLLTVTQDWRVSFYIFGFVGIIPALLVLIMPDYKAVKEPGETLLSKAYFKDWGKLFKIKSYRLYIMATIFLYFIAFAIPAWLPTLLIRTYQLKPVKVGGIIAALNLVFLFAPLGGVLADRWQKRSKIGRPLFAIMMYFLFLVGFLAAAITVGSIPFKWWMILYVFMALCTGFVTPAVITLPHDFVPVGIRSTAIGIQTLIAQLLGGMLGPIFVGAVSDALGGGAHGIKCGLVWVVPISALSMIMLIIMLRYYHSDSANISDAVMAER
jgi:MFS transporter, Spinster family, sphingosine-1-phosphate transporter